MIYEPSRVDKARTQATPGKWENEKKEEGRKRERERKNERAGEKPSLVGAISNECLLTWNMEASQ